MLSFSCSACWSNLIAERINAKSTRESLNVHLNLEKLEKMIFLGLKVKACKRTLFHLHGNSYVLDLYGSIGDSSSVLKRGRVGSWRDLPMRNCHRFK